MSVETQSGYLLSVSVKPPLGVYVPVSQTLISGSLPTVVPYPCFSSLSPSIVKFLWSQIKYTIKYSVYYPFGLVRQYSNVREGQREHLKRKVSPYSAEVRCDYIY